jgi:predicted deacylase
MVGISAVVVHGRRPGATLWISGGIHGDELNGVEIVRRILRVIAPEKLAGTLVAVPCVNEFGLLHQSRYLPDRRDLNRSFPGTARGSLASRLAYRFIKDIAQHCSHGIDLHAGAMRRTNYPQIRANLDHAPTRAMAVAFGAPVTLHSDERDGSLRQAASKLGIATLLYEAGEAMRLDTDAVETGVSGVLRVMQHLGMRLGKVDKARTVIARETVWIRAEHSGWAVLNVKSGQRVSAGERLGIIHAGGLVGPDAESDDQPVLAPIDGIVIGRLVSPLVHMGDALVNLARVGKAASRVPRRTPA